VTYAVKQQKRGSSGMQVKQPRGSNIEHNNVLTDLINFWHSNTLTACVHPRHAPRNA